MIIETISHSKLPASIRLARSRIDRSHSSEGLIPEEAEELNLIRHEGRRGEFVSSRLLLRKLAGEMGYDPSGFKIVKDEYGKPFGQAGDTKLNLSIAHSESEVVCGISDTTAIGVDLEPEERPVEDRLARRIAHPEEEELLKDVRLIRLWTIKEAMVKLEGSGLRTNLNELRVARIGETEFSGRFNNDKSARICSFQHAGHWISIAYFP